MSVYAQLNVRDWEGDRHGLCQSTVSDFPEWTEENQEKHIQNSGRSKLEPENLLQKQNLFFINKINFLFETGLFN
jgi:hypothetical protein